MEVGHITPVHKKGSKNLMENYRQITLTCIVCKIAETVVRTLVVAFGQSIGIFKELEMPTQLFCSRMHEEGIWRRWDKSILPYIFNQQPDEEEVATHNKERRTVSNPRPKSA